MILLLMACQSLIHPPFEWSERRCRYSPPSNSTKSTIQRYLWIDEDVQLNVVAQGPDSGHCLPAIVVMPPGLQAGSKDVNTTWSEQLSLAGYWVIHWDPRGRGESTGLEVANGPQGSSDAAAVLRWASALDGIDPDKIMILSRSFGGALAAGALGQHRDLAPYIWVDYESPGWLQEDIQQVEGRSREQLESMATGADWWLERSPAYWAPNITQPYFRIQGIPDHAQGARYAHAQSILERMGTEKSWINLEIWDGSKLSETDLVSGGIHPDDDLFLDWVKAAEQLDR